MSNLQDPVFRRAIFDRDGGLCGFCGQPVEFERMHLDHIKPEAVGGQSEPENLRPAHARCNIGNGRKSVYAYRRENPGTKSYEGHSHARVSMIIPQSLRDWLERQADAEHRNFTEQVTHYLDLIRAGKLVEPPH